MPLNKLNIKKKKTSMLHHGSHLIKEEERDIGTETETVTAGKTAATRLHRHDGGGEKVQIQDAVKSGEMSISAMGGGRRAVCSESREAECIELGQSRHQDREGADLPTGEENKTGDVMGHRWTSRHPSSALDTQEDVLCGRCWSGHALEKGSVTRVQKKMRSLLSQEMFAFRKLPSIITGIYLPKHLRLNTIK